MPTTHEVMVTLLCSGWRVEPASAGVLPSLVIGESPGPPYKPRLSVDERTRRNGTRERCYRGHPKKAFNIYIGKNGVPHCLACRRIRAGYSVKYRVPRLGKAAVARGKRVGRHERTFNQPTRRGAT